MEIKRDGKKEGEDLTVTQTRAPAKGLVAVAELAEAKGATERESIRRF